MPQLAFLTPLGPLTVFEEGGALVAVEFGEGAGSRETPLLAEARTQIGAYFDGRRTAFDLPLDPAGTAFRRAVWQRMRRIPYGETATYGALAADLGSSARAVGTACGRNPLPIVIPCHRVVGAAGPGGYSGGDGVDTKLALLALEGAVPARPA